MALFGRKKKNAGIEVMAPVAGRIRKIEDVPDPVFAQKLLGDGFAVEPTDGNFLAPVAGELILLAETLHAYAIRSEDGLEVLVHIGIDTVKLKGEGFSSEMSTGAKVAVGDLIVRGDLEAVAAKVPSMMTPVIITNGSEFTSSEAELDPSGGPVLILEK